MRTQRHSLSAGGTFMYDQICEEKSPLMDTRSSLLIKETQTQSHECKKNYSLGHRCITLGAFVWCVLAKLWNV